METTHRPLAEYPELMTVKESAAYLRIGVSTCYELTKRYADTDGRQGIPAVKVGGRTFVIRDRLGRYLGGDGS